MIVNAYFRALEDALVAAEESSFDIDLNNREQLSNLVRAVRPSTHRYSRGTRRGTRRGTPSRPPARTDRDAHAVRAEVAEPEDARAVRHDDHVHL